MLQIDRANGISVTTTILATSVLAAIKVPTGFSGHAMGVAIGRTAAGATIALRVAGTVKNVSGVVSLVGASVNVAAPAGDAAVSTAVAAITVSGLNAQLSVTGVALTTIVWEGWLELTSAG